jgi:uncharacterized integral membrane protein
MNTQNRSKFSVLPIDQRSNDVSTQTNSKSTVQTKKSKMRYALPIIALLLVLAIGVFLASITRAVSISGISDRYVLKPNQIRIGILIINDNASAIFQEGSHWIGPIISKEGALIVQDDVTITGPVVLFSDGLHLGKNTIVDGSVYLFSGGLTLEPGASVRHNAVLFAGGLTLEPEASIQDNAVLFAGGLTLKPGSSVRRNAVLFAGNAQIGAEAATYGKLILFFGGLELAPKAVLHDDAVLFFGNVHLSPQAQVRGDVILTDGDARLDGPSTIFGRLYLSPESGWGRLSKSSNAQIIRGVIRPANIDSVVAWHIGGWALGILLTFILLPVVVIGLLMALMFYLGRRSRSPKPNDEAKKIYPESSPQPATPGLG